MINQGPDCDDIPAAPDAAASSRGDAADVPAWLSSLVSVDKGPACLLFDSSDPPTAAPANIPATDMDISSESDCPCVFNDDPDIVMHLQLALDLL